MKDNLHKLAKAMKGRRRSHFKAQNKLLSVLQFNKKKLLKVNKQCSGQRYLPAYVSFSLNTSAVRAEMVAFMASFQLDGLSRESSK